MGPIHMENDPTSLLIHLQQQLLHAQNHWGGAAFTRGGDAHAQ